MASVSTIGQKELANLLGLTTRQIGNLVSAGMPVEADGRHPRYPIPAAIRWYVQYKEQAAERSAAPADLDEARARRESALAQQEELKLAEMQRQLMTVDEYQRVCHDRDSRVAARLKTLPHKLAPVVVGVRDTVEALTRIQPLVDEVMDELFRAEDVPGEPE